MGKILPYKNPVFPLHSSSRTLQTRAGGKQTIWPLRVPGGLGSGSLATLDVKHVKQRGEFAVSSALKIGSFSILELPAKRSLGCQAVGHCWAVHAGHATALCQQQMPWLPWNTRTALSATVTTHSLDCKLCCWNFGPPSLQRGTQCPYSCTCVGPGQKALPLPKGCPKHSATLAPGASPMQEKMCREKALPQQREVLLHRIAKESENHVTSNMV